MNKVKILVTMLLLCCMHKTEAQVDPHFSQYYVYPMWLNPALTGAIDGDYRVSAIYRNQWSNITNAFSTVGISADMQTEKNINLGINILQQNAGSGGYSYLNAQASIAYTGLKFGSDGRHRISFALQPGIIQRRFDQSKFKSGNQWTPFVGYDPSIPTSEILTKSSALVFDMGAGISYYDASSNSKVNFFGGFAASHLTAPSDAFIIKNDKSTMPIRYTLHAGARTYLTDAVYFVPNVLYMMQGSARETMLGGYFQLAVGATNDVMLGANYRFNDAVSPFAGLLINSKLMIGLSYDVSTSQLGKIEKGTNAFELSISFLGNKKDRPGFFKCPRF